MRRLVALVVLLWAPAAHAQPQALGPADELALAGGAAIVAHTTSSEVIVRRVPLDGTAPTTLFRSDIPARRSASVDLVASDQRVGMFLTLAARRSGILESAQLVSGPPQGPLLATGAPFEYTRAESEGPSALYAAGDAIVVEDDRERFTAIAPDGTGSAVDIPVNTSGVEFAGDLVALGLRDRNESEEDPPTKFALRNWRTGETIRSLALPAGLIRADLREDGRALLELDGPLYELSAGGKLSRLPFDASTPLQAGDRTVVRRHDDQLEFDRLVVIEAGDTGRHDVGLKGRAITGVAADAATVVFKSNGCAFAVGVEEGPSQTFANAGCRAAEPYIVSQAGKAPRLSRRLSASVGCLNAADGVCRGTLRGREIAAAPFAVPVGERRRITFSVRPRAYRKLKRTRYRHIHFTSPPGFPLMLRDGPRRPR